MTFGAAVDSPDVDDRSRRVFATLGAGELLSRLIGFAGTIYIARQLGDEMWGVIGIGFAVLMYTTILADCGLEYTGPREVVQAKDDLSALLSSLLVTRTIAALLFAAIQVVGSVLLLRGVERSVLALYSLALLPVGLNLRWAHLGLERAGTVSLARMVSEGTKLAGILLFVRSPSDVLVVPIAQVTGDMVAAALLLWTLRGRGLALLRFDARLALGVVRRALPMLLSALLAMVIYNSDLIFLRLFRTPVEVGRYLAAYSLLNFLGILGHMVALSLTPALTRLRATPDQRSALLQNSLVGVFAAGLPIAVGATITAPAIIEFLFGRAFQASAPALAVLMWCLPVLLYRSVLQAALVSSERPGDVLRTTIVAALVNVALNFVAVPLFGMIGAAFTTVVAETARAVVARGYVRGAGFSMPRTLRYASTAGAGVAMAAVLVLIRPAALWLSVAVAIVTYVVVLLVLGGLRVRPDGVRLVN